MSKQTQKLPLFLSKKEMETFNRFIRRPKHVVGFALMSYGGLRVSEVCTLKVGDLNIARGFIKVHGKGNKDRVVPLNARLQNIIESYLRENAAILTPESRLVGGVRQSWHYLCKRYARVSLCRTDIHCHTLRHSFATSLYEEGVQIERIGQILGHSKLDTTMIYAHISVEQKREAVMVLDNPRCRLVHKIITIRRTVTELTVKPWHDRSLAHADTLIGRDSELKELTGYLEKKISVILYGPKGSGKSALLRAVIEKKCSNQTLSLQERVRGSAGEVSQERSPIFIDEFRKKQTLIKIILNSQHLDDPEVCKEAEKEMKKLSIEELLSEIKELHITVIIDDITELSRTDRKTISKLSQVATVAASSTRHSDKKLFATYMDIKPLRRHHTRMILSDMIQMTDPHQKERVVDDILHTSGDNLKEAEYIARQMQLGKSTQEITTDERISNQVSIAPVLTIVLLFFVAWILKSYAAGMVAFSYAVLVVFRLVFYRYIFTPANSKRKQ